MYINYYCNLPKPHLNCQYFNYIIISEYIWFIWIMWKANSQNFWNVISHNIFSPKSWIIIKIDFILLKSSVELRGHDWRHQHFIVSRINEMSLITDSKTYKCNTLPVFVKEYVGMNAIEMRENTNLAKPVMVTMLTYLRSHFLSLLIWYFLISSPASLFCLFTSP